jgi:hypothetical protein
MSIYVHLSSVLDMLQAWEFLAIKLVSVPIFILIISMVAHRWGPSVGGVVLGLPLTSGPILLFLALEQGTSFAAASALGTLIGLISLAASCIVFSWLSFRLDWLVCLIGCCVIFFTMTLILYFVSFPSVLSLVGVVAVLVLICRIFPSGASASSISRESARWEIPARMIAATGLVLLITGAASILGAHLSGLLTPFPVYATVMGLFMLKSEGPAVSALFLRGVIMGCLTTSVFLFLIASFIVSLGLIAVFGLAVAVVITLHSVLLYSVNGNKRLIGIH